MVLFSCSKNSDEIESKAGKDVNQLKIENVLSIKNGEDQKIAFGLLNENEKYTLWNEKLKNILNNENLNEQQENLVFNIIKDLNPSVYSSVTNDYDEYFSNIISKKFIQDAEKLFSSKQIKEYFFQINEFSKTDAGGIGDNPNDPSCNCNNAIIGGWDCSFPEFCKATGVTCVDRSLDCGVLNTSPCDGICKYSF